MSTTPAAANLAQPATAPDTHGVHQDPLGGFALVSPSGPPTRAETAKTAFFDVDSHLVMHTERGGSAPWLSPALALDLAAALTAWANQR
jgi:hypothetical protein